MIPELELPNSKKKPNSTDKPMKGISTDKHRQRFGIFVASIFAFTLGFIFFQIQTERPLDGEWKELILVLIGALIGNFGKIIDYWFSHKPTDHQEE
jgi:hypothetical protein